MKRHVRFWFAPPSIKHLVRHSVVEPPVLLDVGCAFGSALKLKRFYPDCEYHGLDRDDRSLSPADLSAMHRFYSADLETNDLSEIPDSYFDAIIVSHVIEHLRNAEVCLGRLTSKLKTGGLIYVEYPGVRSLGVPRAHRGGFLHFHDDPTHVRIYSIPDVANALIAADCNVVTAGIRRDRLRLALTPALALRGLWSHGSIWSGRLWDWFAIAEFVMARRNVYKH